MRNAASVACSPRALQALGHTDGDQRGEWMAPQACPCGLGQVLKHRQATPTSCGDHSASQRLQLVWQEEWQLLSLVQQLTTVEQH